MLKRDSLIDSPRKPIRSFIARQGRKTAKFEQIVNDLWPVFGLSLHKPLDQQQIFGRVAPLTLEIGFGNGQNLLENAANNPGRDFVGIEVYTTGIAQLLAGIGAHGLQNIRIYHADAIEVLTSCIADNMLEVVQLLFPDPWPKARHHKRRIVQSDFVALVASKVMTAGLLHMATDWENYAEHMLVVLEGSSQWQNTIGVNKFAPRPETRIVTKFERRGFSLGHNSWDLIFQKRPASNIL